MTSQAARVNQCYVCWTISIDQGKDMFANLFAKPSRSPALALYSSIVDVARSPQLYTRFAIPDTLDGRFDVIALHLALVLERLKAGGQDGARLQMAVIETFIADMDATVRELGVSDIGVGRRVKQMADALNGRWQSYTAALTSGNRADLEQALARNVYREAPPAQLPALAAYVAAQAKALEAYALDRLLAGDLGSWGQL